MAINFRFLRSLAFALPLIIGLASQITAQDAEQRAGYFIDPDSEETRFIQRLVWSGGEYTSRYEVIIERQEGRTYRRHARNFTEDAFLDISLSPGHYRFCVIPYDILDRPGEGTDWVYIEVRRAVQPSLVDSSQAIVKEKKKATFFLDIFGDNIDPNAEIFMRNANGLPISPEYLEFYDDGGFRLVFNCRSLKNGEYEVYVKNPGGLEASMKIVYAELESIFKLNIGASYMPVFRIYGSAKDQSISIIGAALRVSGVFSVSTIYIGPELTMSWCMGPDRYGIRLSDKHTAAAGLDLLIGKQILNKKMAFNIRLGGGYTLFMGDYGIQEEIQGEFHAYAGLSFFWRIARSFFMEIGADYSHQFNESNSGFMRPWIGFGVQF